MSRWLNRSRRRHHPRLRIRSRKLQFDELESRLLLSGASLTHAVDSLSWSGAEDHDNDEVEEQRYESAHYLGASVSSEVRASHSHEEDDDADDGDHDDEAEEQKSERDAYQVSREYDDEGEEGEGEHAAYPVPVEYEDSNGEVEDKPDAYRIATEYDDTGDEVAHKQDTKGVFAEDEEGGGPGDGVMLGMPEYSATIALPVDILAGSSNASTDNSPAQGSLEINRNFGDDVVKVADVPQEEDSRGAANENAIIREVLGNVERDDSPTSPDDGGDVTAQTASQEQPDSGVPEIEAAATAEEGDQAAEQQGKPAGTEDPTARAETDREQPGQSDSPGDAIPTVRSGPSGETDASVTGDAEPTITDLAVPGQSQASTGSSADSNTTSITLRGKSRHIRSRHLATAVGLGGNWHLLESLPQDLTHLERAMERLLRDQLEIGRQLADWLTDPVLLRWVLVSGIAVVTLESMRRRARHAKGSEEQPHDMLPIDMLPIDPHEAVFVRLYPELFGLAPEKQTMTEKPLEKLLQQLTLGDPQAADEIFRAYEPYLRMVVRRQLSRELRAKFDSTDIVQSAWVDILSGFREMRWTFPDAEHLRAFLVKVTHNRFIDRIRQHASAIEHEQVFAMLHLDAEVDCQATHPSEVAQANELWEELVSVCPPHHRDVLDLKRSGCSLDEIAARTGYHKSSVRRILYKLARRLAAKRGSVGA